MTQILKAIVLVFCLLTAGCAFEKHQNQQGQELFVQVKEILDTYDLSVNLWSVQEAEIYLDSLERLGQTSLAHHLASLSMRQIIQAKLGNLRGSLLLVNEEIQALNELIPTQHALLSQAFYRRGDLFMDLGQYELAFRDFVNGRENGKIENSSFAEGNFFYRLAMINYRKNEFDEAISNFTTALKNFQANDNGLYVQYRLQEIASNIGLCNFRLKQYTAALAWFDTAMVYIQVLPLSNYTDSIRYLVAKEVILGNKGLALYEMGEKVAGMALIDASIAYNLGTAGADAWHACFLAHHLSDQLLIEGHSELAKTYLLLTKAMVNTQPFSRPALKLNRNLLQVYSNTGKKDSLSAVLSSYFAINDSIKKLDRSLYETNTELILSGMEKDFSLKAEVAKTKAQERINHAIFTVLLVLIAAIILILNLLSATKRKNQLLAELNDDITQKHQQLQEARQQLEKSNETQASLLEQQHRVLRVMAHDLRNPLAAMYALSEIHLEKSRSNGHDSEFYELIHMACKGGLEMIHEVLNSVQVTAPAATLIPHQMVPLASYLNDTLLLVQHQSKQKDIELQLDYKLAAHAQLLIQPERFRRALINLLSNAIKFSNRQSLVKLYCFLNKDSLCIAVEDQGIGIPEQEQLVLFNSFTEARKAGTEGEKAFGLGLSISRQIVRDHQGDIQVSSTPGQGATFTIVLPAKLVVSAT